MQEHDAIAAQPTYSSAARSFHWITAIAVFVMVPLGLTMSYRGNTLDIWDDLTNNLYSSHKLIGFCLLWLIVLRLSYRFTHGAPPDEPTLERWQKVGSHLVHWSLYALLLIVPMLGWTGVSLFPALEIFGLFNLPALTAPNEDMAKRVLDIHGWLAIGMALLIGVHVAAATYHALIRRDGVFRRMWPSAR